MLRSSILIILSAQASLALAQLDTVTIPEGNFNMGCSTNDSQCATDEGPQGGTPVFVPTFKIDRNEVTVADYAACVEDGDCEEPVDDSDTHKYCNYGNDERDKHPVNCVDWQEAVTYCASVGGRLPFEAEWEKAARAGTETRYPWGQEATCEHAILDDGKTFGSVPNEPDGCGEDRTWPIASRAPNAFGLYDMHGNAGEWIQNWYAPNAISQFYAKGDLAGATRGKKRMVRGGSWDENRPNLRSSYRNLKAPFAGRAIYGSLGFRCAYDVK